MDKSRYNLEAVAWNLINDTEMYVVVTLLQKLLPKARCHLKLMHPKYA